MTSNLINGHTAGPDEHWRRDVTAPPPQKFYTAAGVAPPSSAASRDISDDLKICAYAGAIVVGGVILSAATAVPIIVVMGTIIGLCGILGLAYGLVCLMYHTCSN
jgi:hypothetical protein